MDESSRTRKKVHFGDARTDRAERRKLFRNYTVGSYDSFDASSGCVVDEKTVVLQKRDSEGFGFVLRGAKADTPIEEFSPTPAFPALQYLESVDDGGVAWQAGLRTGDFMIEVNQDNVVKVGHKQVVNMIRHGGNRLIIKVVTVSRNPNPDDTNRTRVPLPARRAPPAALSMAMRSKSMTSELEELATLRRKKGDTQDERPAWDSNSTSKVEARPTPPKSRPSSRGFPFNPEVNSMCESKEMSMQTERVPPSPRAAYLGVPRQGTIRRQKSIGITEEEKQFLTPPTLKFTRSLSMPDTSEEIPPPPEVSPPSPPSPSPYTSSPQPQGRGYGGIMRPALIKDQTPAAKGGQSAAERGGGGGGERRGGGTRGGGEQGSYYCDSSTNPDSYSNHGSNSTSSSPLTAQQSFLNRRAAAQVPENPYCDLGRMGSSLGMFTPNKLMRKGMLVKQPKIEDSPEKVCSIPIPTIIIKEPSTSSSGKSSQGSSMEVETGVHDLPGQLRPDDGSNTSNTFASAMSVMRDRRLADHRNSVSFRSTDETDTPPSTLPRLRHSKSIDEGMFGSEERLHRIMTPPRSLLNSPRSPGSDTSETPIVREVLNTKTGLHQHHQLSPLSLPTKSYTPPALSTPSRQGPYVHPVTGKPLDPNSPLALALAARDQAMREQNQPLPLKTEPPKPDLNKPLFIDTKLARPSVEVGFATTTTTTVARSGSRGALRRQMTDSKYETETKHEHPLAIEEKRQQEERTKLLVDIVDTSQQKAAGLLMVHTSDRLHPCPESSLSGEELGVIDSTPGELRDPNQPTPPIKTIVSVSSVEEPIKLPFGMIPPPPLASVDIPEDELFPEPLPPPLEFANSFDIPEDQVSAIAELLKQTKGPLSLSAQDQSNAIADLLKQSRSPSSVSASTARHASLISLYPTHIPPNNNNEIKRAPAVLTNCMPPSFPAPALLESYEPISDSGIEDSRSIGDPQLETTSTVSTVSSISTLSSEGGEGLDTCTVYADGQTFPGAALINKSNKSSKAKAHNALYANSKEPGMEAGVVGAMEESLRTYSGGGPLSSIPPPPPVEAPKTPIPQDSGLWGEGGEGKGPLIPNHGNTAETATRKVFGTRNPDNPSGVPQHRNTVTFASMPSPQVSCQQTNSHSGSNQNPRPLSPSLSPPDSGLGPPPSLPSPSPTLTVMFGAPPLSLGTGHSRSPSPLALHQNAKPASTTVSNKAFASKPLLLWSKADVADWLESLNLSEHQEAFLDNDIEGSHLPSLQKDDLIDLGVTRVGHRMNIERALKVLMDR